MTPRSLSLAVVASAALLPSAAAAQPWNAQDGAVAAGYDVVSYVDEGRAERGLAEHQVTHRGGVFRFASAAHRDAFLASPARYLPAYGGYCAYAMARGERVRIDPNAFRVHRGRLYLNYSLDVRRTWDADRDRFVHDADEHWSRVR